MAVMATTGRIISRNSPSSSQKLSRFPRKFLGDRRAGDHLDPLAVGKDLEHLGLEVVFGPLATLDVFEGGLDSFDLRLGLGLLFFLFGD